MPRYLLKCSSLLNIFAEEDQGPFTYEYCPIDIHRNYERSIEIRTSLTFSEFSSILVGYPNIKVLFRRKSGDLRVYSIYYKFDKDINEVIQNDFIELVRGGF